MYTFNEESARKADRTGGKITEHGAYIGTFKRAEDVTAKSGAKGIQFAFESDDEEYATFTIYTIGKDGKPIFGMDKVNALMKILRSPTLSPAEATVDKWDNELKKSVPTKVNVFQELMGKPIGVMFNTVENEDQGNVNIQLDPVMFFRANDRMTVTEILDKSVTAIEADKMEAKLRHIPLSGKSNKGISAANYAAQEAGGNPLDDMPF